VSVAPLNAALTQTRAAKKIIATATDQRNMVMCMQIPISQWHDIILLYTCSSQFLNIVEPRYSPDGRSNTVMNFIIRLTHVNVWESMGEALQLHTVYKKPYFLLQVTRESVSVLQVMSRENPYQVLQVTRAASECAMKSKVHMIKSLSP